jgi:MFS transporter, SET family, sugar efflux transporter
VWWRSLAPLGFVTVLVGLTGAVLAPFMPVFLGQQVKASPLQLSLFLFLTPVAAMAVSNVVGRVSDRPGGRLRVIYVAAVGGTIGFALYAAVRQYWMLLAVALSLVAVAAAIVPQIYALGREVVQREDPSRVTMGMNGLRMMMSLAWAAGAPVGAFLLGAIDFNGLFIATSLIHLVVLAVAVMLKDTVFRPSHPAPPPVAIEATPAVADPAGVAPSRAMLVAISVAFVVLQSVTVLTVTTMPLFVSVDLRGSFAHAGAILGLCAAIEIPLMLAFGALATRWPLHRLLLIGGLCGVAYCVVVSLATSVWQVAAAQVLHACFVCCIGGLGITYFQELMPTALGRATTLFTNAGRLAGMVSGLAFGLVQVHGYRLAYVGGIGLAVTGTTVLAAISRRRRHEAPSAELALSEA